MTSDVLYFYCSKCTAHHPIVCAKQAARDLDIAQAQIERLNEEVIRAWSQVRTRDERIAQLEAILKDIGRD